jgi:hypothetical protein
MYLTSLQGGIITREQFPSLEIPPIDDHDLTGTHRSTNKPTCSMADHHVRPQDTKA